jgi:hypothetical protein
VESNGAERNAKPFALANTWSEIGWSLPAEVERDAITI